METVEPVEEEVHGKIPLTVDMDMEAVAAELIYTEKDQQDQEE